MTPAGEQRIRAAVAELADALIAATSEAPAIVEHPRSRRTARAGSVPAV
jgi:hypothetical protein